MPALKTGLFILILIFSLSACQSSDSALQGAVVPTRIATGTPTQTATPTPTATATNTPTPTLTPTAVIPSVEIGSVFSFETTGTLNASDWRVRYIFDADAGDVISVQMNTDSPRLDPLIILENEAGERLTVNDDAVEGVDNAAILNYVIENDGTYALVASRRGEEDSPYIGDYEISYLRLPASYYDPATGISLRPIEANQEANGEISDEAFFVAYVFTGNTGDVVSVEMNRVSGNLDAYLILVNRRTRTIIAENDDDERDETTNAYLSEISLPENGEYLVLATRYQGADGLSTGEFSLQVIREE